MNNKEPLPTLILGGKPALFHVIMDRNNFALSEFNAIKRSMPDEYAVFEDETSNSGLVVFYKRNGKWIKCYDNDRTTFLIRVLLKNAGIPLPSLHNE